MKNDVKLPHKPETSCKRYYGPSAPLAENIMEITITRPATQSDQL